MHYIYGSHLGGIYFTKEIQKDIYCDQCGDSDYMLGEAETKEQARKIITEHRRDYLKSYINEVISQEFKEED